ncbi:MAG: glycogen debranching enzyme N-terminal domain-containing protein, partial [Candidatus Eisenbacteria bacterium]
MRLGQDVLSDLDAALAREWLLANGLGGSASGTAAGAHTRRAHALLIAAGPHGRLAVALLKLDERLHAGAESVELGCNLYAAATPGDGGAPAAGPAPGYQARPAGHLLLEEFRADPWPAWRWRAGGVTLEKSVFLVQGHNAVAVAYRHLDGPSARLTVSPLIAARDPHGLQRESDGVRGAAQAVPGRVRFEAGPGWPALTLWHSGAFMPARVWQRGLVHPAEPRPEPGRAPGRGKSRRAPDQATEDAFVPGYLECALPVGGAFHVVAAIEEDLFRALAVEGRLGAPPPRTLAECVELLARGERDRSARWRRAAFAGADFTARQAATAHGGPGETLARRSAPLVEPSDPWVPRLAQALADGLVQRGERTTLLASLPAGAERGEDTLRALPALITLRAFEPAREVLRGYVEYLNEGLAPETFDPAGGRPRYGDPAPALWLVHAAELLARRSEDLELVRDAIYPAVESIMQAYRAGTRGGIRVGADGLLSAGEGEAACCRADLNALWFHALVATAQLARLTGRKESGAFYLAWAREHQTRMLAAMWDEKRGCLYEALTADGPRPGLSPSQLLAVSLPPPLLPPERAARLVAAVERELFTPLGLRASAGADTASPAWLGPFITAYLRVHQRSAEAQARAHGWLEALRERLDERAAAHVPEALPAPRRGDAAARRAATAAATVPPAPASVLAAAALRRVWV